MSAGIGLIGGLVAILGLLFRAYWLAGIGAVIFLVGGGLAFTGTLDLPWYVWLAIILGVIWLLSKKK